MLERREFIGGAALLALVLGTPAKALGIATSTARYAASARQRAVLSEVCQLVIPATATAGAAQVGVPDFVVLALAHGLLGTGEPAVPSPPMLRFQRADGTLDHLAWLEADLDGRAGGDFLRAAPPLRVAYLTALDAEAYPAGPPPATPSPWQAIKGLVLTGYYTSETGGAKELQYELVPGRFDPDLPLHPGDRAWSSDWTAVDFG